MPSLALNVIVKDEIKDVERIIKDYAQYFDELCFAIDDDKVLQQLVLNNTSNCIKFYKYTWCDDFSHKRNLLAEKTQSPYYFRIDCDDEIQNPENIKLIFDRMVAKGMDLVFMPYIYSRDKDGNCNVEHWRETIVKKRPDLYWKKSIHENLIYPDDADVQGFKTDMIKIIHNVDPQHFLDSQERNLGYLLKEFVQDKEKTDPRTISYIGRIYMGLGKFKEAIPYLELLIAKSGWDDDKYFAWIHLANCHKELGDYTMAIASCNEALEMNMKFPDAYIIKGTVYLLKEDYDKALDWFMYGLVRKKPDTMFVIEPSLYTYKIRYFISLAYLGKGDYQNAIRFFNEAYKLAPSDEELKSKSVFFKEVFENENYITHLLWLLNYTKEKDKSKIKFLVDSIPKNFPSDERIWKIRHDYGEAEVHATNSLVIYCGSSWEDWSPASVIKGIGGSEEAVIYISKELAKLGWHVTVYNQCGENAGIYDGVEYKNYFEFNPNDTFNIVISWRNNIFENAKLTLRKAIVWLHDVPCLKDFKGFKHSLDNIVVLSQYHRNMFPKEFSDKLMYVSSNGINTEDFSPSLLTRNPHRIIYTSSYDRGIEHLLLMWKDIRAAVPDAELHLFYGWNTYDKMMAAGTRPKEYRQYMTKLMSQEGVFEHGRIGHKKLVKEFQKSGVWAYPSDFEEISCISAMKAQACGCVPVCTDYAALAETVKGGVKINGKMGEGTTNVLFKEALIKVLKDQNYQEKLRKELPDKKVFSWEYVAKKWNDELFSFKLLEFKDLEDYEHHYLRKK